MRFEGAGRRPQAKDRTAQGTGTEDGLGFFSGRCQQTAPLTHRASSITGLADLLRSRARPAERVALSVRSELLPALAARALGVVGTGCAGGEGAAQVVEGPVARVVGPARRADLRGAPVEQARRCTRCPAQRRAPRSCATAALHTPLRGKARRTIRIAFWRRGTSRTPPHRLGCSCRSCRSSRWSRWSPRRTRIPDRSQRGGRTRKRVTHRSAWSKSMSTDRRVARRIRLTRVTFIATAEILPFRRSCVALSSIVTISARGTMTAPTRMSPKSSAR